MSAAANVERDAGHRPFIVDINETYKNITVTYKFLDLFHE